jgi:hypothetical protein
MEAGNASHTIPVTVETLGTTFTSPTYYVSYRSVFASDGCKTVGPTHYNTIVAIPGSENLSSVYGGTRPCVAHVQNGFTQEWTATASFNVTDMNEPVPFSIYSSQPWCATHQFQHGCNTYCPTTEAYKPIIVVPEVVLQEMDPAWASCYGDIRGVYDPPIALRPAASIKIPETTSAEPTTSEATGAAPASSATKQAAHTKAPITQSDMLVASSAANPVAKPPQDPVSSVDSLSTDLNALQGQGSGTETWSALLPAQHIGDKIASMLESAAVLSAPVPQDVLTTNLVMSRSAQSSQAPHSVDQLHIPSGLDDPDRSQDATVVKSDTASVENSSKQASNADGLGRADTGSETATAIIATAGFNSVAASSSVTFGSDDSATTPQRSTASSSIGSGGATASSVDTTDQSVATASTSESPESVYSLHMIPAVVLTLVTLILAL